MESGNVTISLTREDLARLVRLASSRPDMHNGHCPHYGSWSGVCDCWVSTVRKALKPPTEGGKP